MVPSVTTRNVTLESPGSVILKKRWNALAPSTSAASYRPVSYTHLDVYKRQVFYPVG